MPVRSPVLLAAAPGPDVAASGDFIEHLRRFAGERSDAEVFRQLSQQLKTGDFAFRLGRDDLPIVAGVLREATRQLVAYEKLGKPDDDIAAIVGLVGRVFDNSELPSQAAGSTAFRGYFSALVEWCGAVRGTLPPDRFYRGPEAPRHLADRRRARARFRAAPMVDVAHLWQVLEDLARMDLSAVPERELLVALVADIGRGVPLPPALEGFVLDFYQRPFVFAEPANFVRVLVYVLDLNMRRSNFAYIIDHCVPRWCRYFGAIKLRTRVSMRMLRLDRRDVHARLGAWLRLGSILRRHYGGSRLSLLLLLVKLDALTFARWRWLPAMLDIPWNRFLKTRFRKLGRRWQRLAAPKKTREPDQPGETAAGHPTGLRILAAERLAGTRRDALITRVQGGLGDILMMRPALLRLAERLRARPGRVVFATNPAYYPAFSPDDPIDLVDIEHTDIDVASYGRWINLSEAFESDVEVREKPRVRTNRIDIFARVLRVPFSRFDRSRAFPLRFREQTEAAARAYIAERTRSQRLRVGIQLRSAESYRDVPAMIEVVRMLAQRYEVFVFDNRPIALAEGDCFFAVDNQPLPVAMAMVAQMDAVLAPDSAYIHVAGANGIPCLGLFGPTGGKVRTKNYPSVRYFDMRRTLACIPCWRNENQKCEFGDGYVSVCMKLMAAPMIVAAFEEMLGDTVRPARRSAGTVAA